MAAAVIEARARVILQFVVVECVDSRRTSSFFLSSLAYTRRESELKGRNGMVGR